MAAFKNVAYFKGKHWEIYKIFKSDLSYKTPPVALSGIWENMSNETIVFLNMMGK